MMMMMMMMFHTQQFTTFAATTQYTYNMAAVTVVDRKTSLLSQSSVRYFAHVKMRYRLPGFSPVIRPIFSHITA